MRVFLLITGYLLSLFVLFHPTAYAHIEKSDGAISAILHINPDDDPVAQEKSSLYFDFTDTNNEFSFQNCMCTVDVLANGTLIHTETLSQPTLEPFTIHGFEYTFPSKNVYTIIIHGIPTQLATFQPFTLEYDIRVEKESQIADVSSRSPDTHFFVFGTLIIGLGIIYMSKKKGGGKK
ncbi:MAG TPA: hypothetical protein PLD54_00160 [Candidatus Levybacteria bacterium]|nr:hypothetical protein [Candidatus Levybacteria bacterium]